MWFETPGIWEQAGDKQAVTPSEVIKQEAAQRDEECCYENFKRGSNSSGPEQVRLLL